MKTWARQKNVTITDDGSTVPDPKFTQPKRMFASAKRVPTFIMDGKDALHCVDKSQNE